MEAPNFFMLEGIPFALNLADQYLFWTKLWPNGAKYGWVTCSPGKWLVM